MRMRMRKTEHARNLLLKRRLEIAPQPGVDYSRRTFDLAARMPTRPSAVAVVPPAAPKLEDAGAATSETHAVKLPPDARGERFDVALARALPQFSRARLRTWIDEGRVTEDGRTALPTRRSAVAKSRRPCRVFAAGDQSRPGGHCTGRRVRRRRMLVIDKPAGLVVHPGAGTGRERSPMRSSIVSRN